MAPGSSILPEELKIRYLSRFYFAEHVKPCMHILEINISSQNHFNVRPTKTPKLADKKYGQFYHLGGFKNQSYQKMPITTNVPINWYSSMKKKIERFG